MLKGKLETRDRFYTVGGQVVKPRDFVGRDGFKFVNHIARWARGGGDVHIGRARRWIEERIVGLGLEVMRSPTELEFWGPPYFNQIGVPGRPDDPNEQNIVNLNAGTGSHFRLSSLQKKIIRMFVRLAREYGIFIEVPWCWTIKGEGPSSQDPRKDVSVWNEHYLAAQGVGAYITELRTQGDGEGAHRVDPGYIPFINEAANEAHVHADRWNKTQLRNIFRRWHNRDAHEILGISMRGAGGDYIPEMDRGQESPDDIRVHPKRHGEWWNTGGDLVRWYGKWNVPIYCNESMLYITQEERAFWVPLIPKWAGLGSSDLGKYWQMIEDFLDHDIYVTIHDFEGMTTDPRRPMGRFDEMIAERFGGSTPPPPPPDDAPEFRQILNIECYRDIMGRKPVHPEPYTYADPAGLEAWNQSMLDGMPLADVREAFLRSGEFRDKYFDTTSVVRVPEATAAALAGGMCSSAEDLASGSIPEAQDLSDLPDECLETDQECFHERCHH